MAKILLLSHSFHRAVVLLAFVACMSFVPSAEKSDNTAYLYKIKVNGVDDPITFKDLCGNLDPIFDSHARFDDSQDLITIMSDVNITEETITRKLTRMGYTLLSYQKIIYDKTPR